MGQKWLSQAYWNHLFCIIAHISVIEEYRPASLLKVLFPQCFFFFVMKMRGDCHPELSSDAELVPVQPSRFQLNSMRCSALPKKWPVKVNEANVSVWEIDCKSRLLGLGEDWSCFVSSASLKCFPTEFSSWRLTSLCLEQSAGACSGTRRGQGVSCLRNTGILLCVVAPQWPDLLRGKGGLIAVLVG